MTESGRTAIAGRNEAARQRSPGIFAIELGRPVPGQASVVFIPALGVPVSYYRPLLRAWEEAGRHVLAVESRGAGATPRELKRQGFGYRHLLSDLVDAVSHSSAGAGPVVVGHSLGGQLALFATATKQVNPSLVVTIASGSSQVPRNRPMAERIRRATEIAVERLARRLGSNAKVYTLPAAAADYFRWARQEPGQVVRAIEEQISHGDCLTPGVTAPPVPRPRKAR